jgi:large repetitive protein
MIRYHSTKERRSRLTDLENKRLVKQTFLLVFAVIAIMAVILFVGIPSLVKLAVLLGNLKGKATPIVQTDTVPPATPQVNTIPDATSSATLTLSGFTEPGATAVLYQNGERLSDTPVDTQGNFVFTDITLNSGLNRFYIIAKDAASNESLQSSTQTIIYDNATPTLTVDSPQDGHQYFGLSQQMLTVQGKTDPDVTLKLNDHFLVVNSDGSFTGRFQLQTGDNHLTLIASDPAGNQTQTSLTVKFSTD